MIPSFQFIGLERIQEKLTPDLYMPSIHDVLRDSSSFATREAQQAAGRDLGAIAQTIGATVTMTSATVTARHPGALAAEYGRRAGAAPPPTTELDAWAAHRGLQAIVFVIARAIGRRGIAGRFFMRQAADRLERSEMPRLLSIAAAQIEARWGAP